LITHVCNRSIAAILREAPPGDGGMTAWVGWGLAVAAVAVGYAGYGWPGVVLALGVVVFWLLLQFSRALRTLRVASARPVGTVPSAVMLHAKLRSGLRLPQVLALTRSLGRRVADEPETFAWRDEAGDEVQVELRNGHVTAWRLQRGP
jgi:Flp pilus assembly protein TadB